MKIMLICGDSGVGKSSVANELCKDPNYNLIKSFTDRPQRTIEYDHIFIDKKHMDELLLEPLAAMTEVDGYRYCARLNQFDEEKINVYIVDVQGINDTIKAFPKAEVMSVLLTRKKVYIDENRKNRDIQIPSCNDVSVAVGNDSTITNCVDTLKALATLNNGVFFKSNHRYVMTIEDKIQYHLKSAQYHNQCAKECQEELKCMQSEE